MRPLGMTGHHGLLPGGEPGIEILQRLLRLGFEAGDIIRDGGSGTAGGGKGLQLGDLRLEFGDGLFKIEIGAHGTFSVDDLDPDGVRQDGEAPPRRRPE